MKNVFRKKERKIIESAQNTKKNQEKEKPWCIDNKNGTLCQQIRCLGTPAKALHNNQFTCYGAASHLILPLGLVPVKKCMTLMFRGSHKSWLDRELVI